MRARWQTWAWSAVIAAAGLSGGIVSGATPDSGGIKEGSVAVAALVRDLHSTKFATREAATLSLMRLAPEHGEEVEDALAQETDAESATRLERAAVHLYMKARTSMAGQVGLLGILLRMEPVQLDPKDPTVQAAVAVVKLQPGFPAAEALAVCDRIVGVDGTRFTFQTSEEDFRAIVNQAHPGTTLHLMVLRDGKLLQVPVRVAGLGSEDVSMRTAIVQYRDSLTARYVAGLKNGAASRALVIADDPTVGTDGSMLNQDSQGQ